MTRREPKVRDTRNRLLTAALEVFAAKGFAHTSVDNIVEGAGCTRGAFYYYFESKEDIARDLQRDLWHQLAERAQEAFDPALGTIANLKKAFDVHLGALGALGHARFFLREGFLDPVLEASGRDELKWGVSLVQELLVDAMNRGEIVDVEPFALADILTGLFEVATTHTLEVSDPTSTIDVVHVILDGLAAPRASVSLTSDTVSRRSDMRPPMAVAVARRTDG
ncbi:MAG TPA: TetR/AcrR family transcriptional regulator [Acidimicrobiales bacterium]|nr:TetR/AcrR family transcriptional regulator [Acidimicrobiales bacterium]